MASADPEVENGGWRLHDSADPDIYVLVAAPSPADPDISTMPQPTNLLPPPTVDIHVPLSNDGLYYVVPVTLHQATSTSELTGYAKRCNDVLLQYERDNIDVIYPLLPDSKVSERRVVPLARCLLRLQQIEANTYEGLRLLPKISKEPTYDSVQNSYNRYEYPVADTSQPKCIYISPKPVHETNLCTLWRVVFSNGVHGVTAAVCPDVILIDTRRPVTDTSKVDAFMQSVRERQSYETVMNTASYSIKGSSLLSLLGDAWLDHSTNNAGLVWVDDDIINAYFKDHILERSRSFPGTLPHVLCVTTHFLPNWEGIGKRARPVFPSLKNMATKESMFDADLVLFPFNANSMPGRKEDHWVLIVAHMAEKQLRLYDSLNYDMQRYCDYVEAALELDASKYEAEPNPRFNLCEWKVVTMPSNNQENGIDCGVFVCKTADAVSQGLPVEINKGNARQMRRTILAELLAAHERHSK